MSRTAPTEHLPGRLVVSHSQKDQWEKCRYQWALARRRRVPRAPAADPITGRAVHAAIEQDIRHAYEHRQAGGDGRPVLTLDRLWAAATVSFSEDLERDDPGHLLGESQREMMRGKALAALTLYSAHVAASLLPCTEPEKRFDFLLPGETEVAALGFFDAVTRRYLPTRQRDVTSIVDFKVCTHQWAAGEEHQRAQAAIYLMASTHQDMNVEQVVFPVFYERPRLPDGRKQKGPSRPLGRVYAPEGTSLPRIPMYLEYRVTTRTSAQMAAAADGLVTFAREVREARARETQPGATLQAVYPPHPSVLCAWCDVLGACPTGRAHLARIGMAPRVPVLEVVPETADAVESVEVTV